MRRDASTGLILTTDFVAFLGIAVATLSIVGPLVLGLLDLIALPQGLVFAIPAASVGAILALWRIALIRRVLADAQEANVAVTSVTFFRDRGRVEFVYSYSGKSYHSANAVMKTRRTSSLQPGQKMLACVDRSRPQQAFLVDLFS